MDNEKILNKIEFGFNQAAAAYERLAQLQIDVGSEMLQRLDLIKIKPQRILDLGCGTGYLTKKLQKRYKTAEVLGLDLAWEMLKKWRQPWWRLGPPPSAIQADMNSLPLANNSIDLIFSNFALHWCRDPKILFTELQRVLKPGGLFMFSILGPDTLKELKAAWQTVDQYQHINSFIDMHDLGDALVKAKFSDPVMDMDYYQLTYSKVKDLLNDLKAQGSCNIQQERKLFLTTKSAWQACQVAYEKWRNPQGKIPASFEIVYGHAWAPDLSAQASLNAQGEAYIPLSAIKRRD